MAKEELKSLLKFNGILCQPPVLLISTDEAIPYDLIGGTVKAGEVIETTISDYLKNLGKDSVDFGISVYGGKGPNPKEIKEELKESGIKSRFVLPTQGSQLSSVVVKKQKLEEFMFFDGTVAHTVWVQDFESWNQRDYGRPAVEAHIGMLPPKVARMMVNLSGGGKILDPFCGVGTILMEALVTGHQVVGNDNNPQQVERTKKNLAWLGKTAEVMVADARQISEKLAPGTVDAVVTEPDLGPNTGNKILPAIEKKLEDLYLASLEDWKKVLKRGGKVVIALPGFGADITFVKNLIDKIQSIGYILTAGPFLYSREQAKVKRNICIFQYGAY